jgi:hypothetical protein
VQEL